MGNCMDISERMGRLSIPEPNSGCFLWMGAMTPTGYGRVRVKGPVVAQHSDAWLSKAAHRVAWEVENGAIPDGMSVLHRCDNRACVNPIHLYLGTQRDNMDDLVRRGRHRNTRKTHCQRGHQLSGENLYTYANKGRTARYCKACHAVTTAAYGARRRNQKAVAAAKRGL